MAQASDHTPSAPRSPVPPPKLVKMVRDLKHPQIMNVGLTTTSQGEWAAMIRVKPGTATPLARIGLHHRGFPVVYQEGSATPPVARPAFPGEEQSNKRS
jgi:hypothetical protein